MGQQHRTGRRAAPGGRAGDCAAPMMTTRTAYPADAGCAVVACSAGEAERTAVRWPVPAHRARIR